MIKSMKIRSAGFTLIELLVVIAIIAILAAILFPVFAQAKTAAKKTVALSNAKQIATANFIYMGDCDDALVKSYYGFPPDNNWGTTYYNWRWALNPYIAKSNGLLADPTNQFNTPIYDQFAYGNGVDKDKLLPGNFAVNTAVIGFANGDKVSPYTPEGMSSLAQLEEPASTIVIVPSRSHWNDLKWYFGSLAFTPETDTSWCMLSDVANHPNDAAYVCPPKGSGPIHAVGKVVSWIWADGHAKAKGYTATLDPTNPDRDDWATKQFKDPNTGQPYTQADRQLGASTAFPEYK